MKFLNSFIYIFLVLLMISCGNDDDICTSGEATPRMKMKFKTDEGKRKTLDSLYLSVDYSSGKSLVYTGKNVDSVLVPLRVDDQLYTDVYVKLTKKGTESKIRINYTTKSEYVSPACGIKRTYENLETELLQPDPVTSTEKNQNQIVNEDKTHLYLIF